MFGNLRKEVGEAISKICKMEGVTIIKAATLPDHVHMYVSIPPKESVAKMVGRIMGKSSLMLFDKPPEYRDRYNRNFWARGYYCETIGNVNGETIKKYIEEQNERDRLEGGTDFADELYHECGRRTGAFESWKLPCAFRPTSSHEIRSFIS